jgi:hypothetical protein
MNEERDASFILRLVNDPDWLRFIGDRNVHNLADAQVYIREGPRRMYELHGLGLYLMERKADREPMGLCGLISANASSTWTSFHCCRVPRPWLRVRSRGRGAAPRKDVLV